MTYGKLKIINKMEKKCLICYFTYKKQQTENEFITTNMNTYNKTHQYQT